MLNIILEIELF